MEIKDEWLEMAKRDHEKWKVEEEERQRESREKVDRILKQAELDSQVKTIDLTKKVDFQPVVLHLRTRHDCAVAALRLWAFASSALNVDQVFYMVDQWAQTQSEREEVMKLIMTTLLERYCPHHRITLTSDSEYRELLQEHREISQAVHRIKRDVSGREEDDNVFGRAE